MRGIHLFLILVTLPALLALGHDVYLFVNNGGNIDTLQQSLHAENEPGIKSYFATLGYIWTHYSPDTYKTVVESTDEDTWKIINQVLAQKAVLVGVAFAAFFYGLTFLLSIFGIGKSADVGSETKFGGRKGSFAVGERQKFTNISLLCYIMTVIGLLPVAAVVSVAMLGPAKGTISRSHFNNILHITIVGIIFGLVFFFGLSNVLKTGEPVLTYSVYGAVGLFLCYIVYRWLFGLMALQRGEPYREG